MRVDRASKLGNLQIPESNNDYKFDIGSWEVHPKAIDINSNENDLDSKPDLSGKKLAINFNLGIVALPHTGEMLKVKGKIPLALPCGLIPKQDLSLVHLSECQEMCNRLGETLGLFSRNSKYFQKFQDVGIPVICAGTAAGIKLKAMPSYAVLMLTFFVLDDIFDNFKDFWTKGLSTNQIMSVVDTFCTIILGDIGEFTEGAIKDRPEFPKFFPICNLLAILRSQVLVLGASKEESTLFFNSFVKYLEACAWETQGWTDPTKTNARAMKQFYFSQREATIGLVPALELICILKNVKLSREVQRDPLFETLNSQLCRHVLILNDIFSLKKEISNEEETNIILIRNKTKSAEYAFTKTWRDFTDCNRNIRNIEKQLLTKFSNDENLKEYCFNGKVWLDAHVQWMFLNRRFGDNAFEIEILSDI